MKKSLMSFLMVVLALLGFNALLDGSGYYHDTLKQADDSEVCSANGIYK